AFWPMHSHGDETRLFVPADFTDTGEIRLDAPGGSMEKVALRNQIGGTCYAYTAAAMFDAARFSSGDERTELVSSGFAAALDYKSKFKGKNPDGGYVCGLAGVMPGLRHRGACSTKALPPFRNSVSLNRTVKIIQAAWKLTREDTLPGVQAPVARETRVKPALIAYGMQTQDLPPDHEIDELLQKKSLTKLLKKLLVEPSCAKDDRIEWDVRRCKSGLKIAKSVRARVGDMNALLRRENAQPIEISFCSAVLTEGYAALSDPKKWNVLFMSGEKCGYHAALVIGRRVRDGQQEFLVRNSWGKSCLPYAPEWECEAGKGNIWVDGNALMKTVYAMAHMKEPASRD
ncbi:MAG: hypothetical protein AAB425_06980, partial [Bdellovibrionota bacterium]